VIRPLFCSNNSRQSFLSGTGIYRPIFEDLRNRKQQSGGVYAQVNDEAGSENSDDVTDDADVDDEEAEMELVFTREDDDSPEVASDAELDLLTEADGSVCDDGLQPVMDVLITTSLNDNTSLAQLTVSVVVTLKSGSEVKVTESGTIRQIAYGFLLVFYRNIVPKMHRFLRYSI